MNLCIDQGNTRMKAALFQGDDLISVSTIEETDISALELLFAQNKIENCIVSSVKVVDQKLLSFLKANCKKLIELSHTTRLPIINKYKTPETLGKDRLAAVIGANALQPSKPVLVIDAGTAITFDFINSQAEYLGGTISPGLEMRFKALHSFTQKLPLISKDGEISLLGTTTETAIRSGVINGMINEINGYIEALRQEYPALVIFFTGGDTFFFENKLKSVIFANQNLVLIGLNRIINHNA